MLGAHEHKQTGKWRARIQVRGRSISLGLYDDAAEAHAAYLAAKRTMHEGCTL